MQQVNFVQEVQFVVSLDSSARIVTQLCQNLTASLTKFFGFILQLLQQSLFFPTTYLTLTFYFSNFFLSRNIGLVFGLVCFQMKLDFIYMHNI